MPLILPQLSGEFARLPHPIAKPVIYPQTNIVHWQRTKDVIQVYTMFLLPLWIIPGAHVRRRLRGFPPFAQQGRT